VETDILPVPGMRRKLGIKSNDVMISVSQKVVGKYLDEIVEAFSVLNSWSGPKTNLVVYGGKKQSRKYKNIDILFVGVITREDELSLLEDSDIYITINEKGKGLSIDILEAGSYGNAIICINVSGRCVVLDDESLGFVVSQGDKELLTERMQKLRLRSNFRKKMSDKLRENIELRYNWNQSALALIDAISELKTIRRDEEWKRKKRLREEQDIFID
jgi:glycosyltransferase involved in cell wall biosynthesis